MEKIRKSAAQWHAELDPVAFSVTREEATERAFSGRYWDPHARGIDHCTCCDTALFASDAKFDSGCGWPSHSRALDPARAREARDASHGMARTEILCSVCDAHLGHVFPDGPPPAGQRYCIDSAALRFEPADGDPATERSA